MAVLLLYLLKASVVLVLFAVAYYGLLRRLTFFGLNRAYLLLALLFAAVYPALPAPTLLSASVSTAWPVPTVAALPAMRIAQFTQPDTPFPWLLVLGVGCYALGAGFLLLRLLMQLLSLAWVWLRARPTVVLGQPVRVVAGAGGPFSFGRTIYLSATTLADATHLPAALHHEQAHVRQWHTLDVLLAQVAVALAWPNPAAWLLRRSVLDNLEYLADRAALQTGLDRRAYQYSLLGQQPGVVPVPALAFHFSLSTLKNRIAMLNKPASPTRQIGRYLLAAPLVMALALGYSAAQAQVVPKPAPTEKPVPADVAYYIDGKKADAATLAKIVPQDIQTMNVVKGPEQQQLFGATSASGTVVVTTKANANTPAVLAFNKRMPLTPATPAQGAAIAAAKAYVTKNYPNAKLDAVGMTHEPGQYQATFTEAGKRVYLLFDDKGQVIP